MDQRIAMSYELLEYREVAADLRRIWQGPGQNSHELREAMQRLFALLPEEEGLQIKTSDSLSVKARPR